MRATVVGPITPHLLRIVEFANDAEKGVDVDWHVRDAVTRTLNDLGQQYNGPELVAAYIEGLESAAAQPAKGRTEYPRVLKAAVDAALNPR